MMYIVLQRSVCFSVVHHPPTFCAATGAQILLSVISEFYSQTLQSSAVGKELYYRLLATIFELNKPSKSNIV